MDGLCLPLCQGITCSSSTGPAELSQYNATTGVTINPSVASVNGANYIAAYPAPGGMVDLFVTANSSGNIGSIQKITVDPSTGTVYPPGGPPGDPERRVK